MKHSILSISLFLTFISAFSQDCTPIRRCINEPFELGATFSAETYEWLSGNALNALVTIVDETDSVYNATLGSSSTLYFKVTTATDTACWVVNPVVLTMNGNAPVCVNDTLQLSASISNCDACTYAWSGTGLTGSSTSPSASFSFDNATDSPYTATVSAQFVEDSYECSTSTNVSITVNPLPEFTFSDLEFCLDASISPVGLDPQETYSYSWSYGEMESPDEAFIFPNDTVNASVSLTVTDDNSCSFALTEEITVFELPQVSIEGDTTLCSGDDLILSTSADESEYSWTFNSNTSSTNTFTLSSLIIGGTVSLEVTDINGCVNESTRAIIVNQLPTGTIEGPESVCLNDVVEYTIDSPNQLEEIIWSTADSDTLVYNHEEVGPVTISATITASNQCVGTISETVTVHALPDASITGDETICANLPDTLTVSSTSQIDDISWSDGSADNTLIFSETSPGNYDVSVQIEDDNGCVGTDSLTITVIALPIATVVGDTLICGRTEFDFTASSSDVNSNFAWSIDGGDILESSNLVFDNGYGEFEIILTTTNNFGCLSETIIEASAITGPVSPIANEIKLCDGSDLELQGNEGYQHEWILTSLDSPIDTITTTDFSYAGLAIGNYQLYLTLTDSTQVGCITLDTASVVMNANPVFTVNSPQISCVGVPFEFSVSEVTVGDEAATDYTVTWTNPSGSVSNENPYSDTALNAGNYTINIQVEENMNECASSQEFEITINTGPSFLHTVAASVCLGSSVILELDSVLASSYSINWQFEGLSIDAATANLILADSLNEYSVSVTNLENGCTSDSTYSIASIALPEILTISLLTDGLLAMNSEAGYSYNWGYTSAATGTEITVSTASDYAYFENFDPANNYYWVEYANESGCVRRVYYNAPPTNISETSTTESFIAYPIPAENTLTIQSSILGTRSKIVYSVFNTQGQMVLTGELQAIDNKTELNVSALSQGQYFVKFITGQELYTLRFSK
jgi:hypothetical protein